MFEHDFSEYQQTEHERIDELAKGCINMLEMVLDNNATINALSEGLIKLTHIVTEQKREIDNLKKQVAKLDVSMYN